MPPIRTAIVGVGNCASALVQGVHLARGNALQGLTYEDIGGYKAGDLEFVIGFDVDRRKIGKEIADAIFEKPNCCYTIDSSTKHMLTGYVHMAPVMDGVASHMKDYPDNDTFLVSDAEPITAAEAVHLLKTLEVDVLINYLPVGSQQATEFWASICLEAEVAMCNCIPVFIASDPVWEQKFIDKNLPLIGDDMRSQFGASVLSQMLQELAFDRGHTVKAHIQQNVGGNTDFLNMVDKSRLCNKKISKENVIRSQNILRNVSEEGSYLFAGPSDYISHYRDNKIATFRLELKGFGGAPVTLDARLSVQDSPNSAGVVIDAVRFLKVAREMGLKGSLRGASAFTQKTPPEQLMFRDAKAECDALAQRTLTDRTRLQI